MTLPGVPRSCLCSCLIVVVSLLAVAAAVQAQELPPGDSSGIEAVPAYPEMGPPIPDSPEVPPMWAPERTVTNRHGTMLNRYQQGPSDDGSQYFRQQTVTNPQGERIQTWERSQDEEGYLYRRSQTFNAPDGTLQRQHEWSRSGTDPYNYTWQHENRLRDGRTVTHEQTRSWDGTTGTMERTFTGPNGQTRHFEHGWAPDDQLPTVPATSPALTAEGAGTISRRVEQPKKKMWGWLERANPFRKGGLFRRSEPSPPRRSGFTLGSGGETSKWRLPSGLSKKQPGQPNPNSRGLSSTSLSGPRPPLRTPLASQPRPSRSRNR